MNWYRLGELFRVLGTARNRVKAMRARGLETCSKLFQVGRVHRRERTAASGSRLPPLLYITLTKVNRGFNLEHLEHGVKWLGVLKLFRSKYRNMLGTTWNTVEVWDIQAMLSRARSIPTCEYEGSWESEEDTSAPPRGRGWGQG